MAAVSFVFVLLPFLLISGLVKEVAFVMEQENQFKILIFDFQSKKKGTQTPWAYFK